jgi:hypothetical protein
MRKDKSRNLMILAVVAAALAMLIVLSDRHGAGAQGCPPGQEWVCVMVCDPATGGCNERCSCCGSAVTPGTPGGATVLPVTPPPTATPFPAESLDFCVHDDCEPGETRYALIHYKCEPWCYVDRIEYLEPCCGRHCPCEELTEEHQPCTPGGGWISCSEFGARVQCGLPVWHADREPYPRALVTMAERVWVTDLPTAQCWGAAVDPGGQDCDCRDDGSCEDDPPPADTICEFKLGLNIEPGNEPPTWRFEGCGVTTGPRAECGWERSSWGRPALGVGMDCEPLPAYTVNATVPYWWSIGRQWEQWEKVDQDCECSCKVCEDPNGCSDECDCHGADDNLCIHDDEFCDEVCEPAYDWRHHGDNWELLDLRDYGWGTPYMLNPKVQLVPHPPCEPDPPVGAIYVPCIEVQAPIEARP